MRLTKIAPNNLIRMAQTRDFAMRQRIVSELRRRADRESHDALRQICTDEHRIGVAAQYTADLHTHTIWSDGNYIPEEVVWLASMAGLKAVGLTDHNSMGGVEAASIAGESMGVEVVPGTEVFVNYNDISVHVMLFGFDRSNSELHDMYSGVVRMTQKRAETEFANFLKEGINIDLERFRAERPGLVYNILIIDYRARDICEEKAADEGISYFEAYEKYYEEAWRKANREMIVGGPIYIPLPSAILLDPEALVKATHNAGGIIGVAHTGQYEAKFEKQAVNIDTRREMMRMLEYFRSIGADALEVRSSRNSPEQEHIARTFTEANNMLQLGGSDMHGYRTSPERILGSSGLTHQEYMYIKDRIF